MNEQNEIRGDEWADVMETAPRYYCQNKEHAADECPHNEREEAGRLTFQPEPLTDAELDDWASRWEIENTPDLNLIGEEPDGTPIWKFQE